MLGEMSVAQRDAPHRSSDENTGQRGLGLGTRPPVGRDGVLKSRVSVDSTCKQELQRDPGWPALRARGHSGQSFCRASRKYGDLWMKEVENQGWKAWDQLTRKR